MLHDGALVGTWSTEPGALVVHHTAPLPTGAAAAVTAEGRRAMRFLEPGTDDLDVRFVAL